MKKDKHKPKESPLEKIQAMWERARQLQERRQYWFELQVQGWIRAENRKEAKRIMEEYFLGRVPFPDTSFGLTLGVPLEIKEALAEITHTQVRIPWFKPYDYSRP